MRWLFGSCILVATIHRDTKLFMHSKEKPWEAKLAFLTKYKDGFWVVFAVVGAIWVLFNLLLPSMPKPSNPVEPPSGITIGGDVSGDNAVIAIGSTINQVSVPAEVVKQLARSLATELGTGTNPNLSEQTTNRLLDNLLGQVEDQQLTIADLEALVSQQASRIKQILNDDDISAEVKALINEGRIDDAEKLVDQHYERSVKAEKKALAQTLYERGQIKELQLKYQIALESFEQAAVLQPNNSKYANQAGSTAHDVAQYDKAIAYYEQALAIFRKRLGDEHPSTKTVASNLESAREAKKQ